MRTPAICLSMVVPLLLAAPAWAQSDVPAPAGGAPDEGATAPPASTAPPVPPPPVPAPPVPPPIVQTATPRVEVQAEAPKKLVQWAMFDFQYLYGFNWNLGPKRKDIL